MIPIFERLCAPCEPMFFLCLCRTSPFSSHALCRGPRIVARSETSHRESNRCMKSSMFKVTESYSLMIGGINIFLPNILQDRVKCHMFLVVHRMSMSNAQCGTIISKARIYVIDDRLICCLQRLFCRRLFPQSNEIRLL